MHFLLSSMRMVYVLTTPVPEDGGDDATVEQIRKRAKWDNGDYVCRGLILNGFNNVYDNIASAFISTSKLNDSILWHARLGHVHFKRMQDMSKDGLIPTFYMDTKKCKTCMLNKITKKPFQNIKRETEVLELIHNDLCDPHATPSLGNKKYFVTFIDDASRIPNGTKDIGDSMVPKEVTEEARISTIRLLIAMASIHNLIIHCMDVKTTFLNGELEEEPAPNKFDKSGKGVIICLYVDDMLIFGTDQVQVNLTKEFLSSNFYMKDMGKAEVILGIRIKHGSNGIAISQSHYIKKCCKVTLMQVGSATPRQFIYKWLGIPAWWWCNFLGFQEANLHYSSTMESEFMALTAAGKEAEWLKNLLLDISIWTNL
ncbi:zinc finger, CCHC-type containing protein [Tanacetum coccineum]|uniref:Zinc finger, CCHC-type containing protein n=1 Tax=Tanacetum coccineum TaxID=301880 RepID=A0ABQ4X494_9ASTR